MKHFKLLLLAGFVLCSLHLTAQHSTDAAKIKEVEATEARMFKNMNFTRYKEYYKTDVADDFFTINADDVTADKAQSFADTARLKMVEIGTLKLIDKKIRIYDNVGIANGRGQVYVDNMLVVEFLYTAVFVKRNGKWMYTSWQGTMSKDSPKFGAPQQ
ncbi:nuclear transport factor 2 family protein [Pinibacter aurantiacus]|uniref:Nuclear transport factor 2 family protein n=1 Tax=Pinibacter aurantiacus TaxID=2851599 RepID=A0A9E2S7F3_9BACT|nr:nuclear transport factor 2 family protein [Pinibacter aurantiacus]MBV4357591.1 nuclear transport factor 2 family protein [Pinibacter aurantiacus]